jgi:hypothetical protein
MTDKGLLGLGELLLKLAAASEAKVAEELLVNALGGGEAVVLGLLDTVAVILLVLYAHETMQQTRDTMSKEKKEEE